MNREERKKARREKRKAKSRPWLDEKVSEREDMLDRHHLFRFNAEKVLEAMKETGEPVGVIVDCSGWQGRHVLNAWSKHKEPGFTQDFLAEMRLKGQTPTAIGAIPMDLALQLAKASTPNGPRLLRDVCGKGSRPIMVVGKLGTSYLGLPSEFEPGSPAAALNFNWGRDGGCEIGMMEI